MKVIFKDIPLDFKYAADSVGYKVAVANTGDVHDVTPRVAELLTSKGLAEHYRGDKEPVDTTSEPPKVDDAGWTKDKIKMSLAAIIEANSDDAKLSEELRALGKSCNVKIGNTKNSEKLVAKIEEFISEE